MQNEKSLGKPSEEIYIHKSEGKGCSDTHTRALSEERLMNTTKQILSSGSQ